MRTGLTEKPELLQFYGGQDPRELPNYPLDMAARFLMLPKSTLKAWVFGARWKPKGQPSRTFEPLIEPPDRSEPKLSFVNLVEAHVLKSIRRKYFVRMETVRGALEALKATFDTTHPLADVDLLTGGGKLFLQQHGELLSIGHGKQVAMSFLQAYLVRIEREIDMGHAIKLFPFVVAPMRIGNRVVVPDTSKIVAIDPYVSFGRPIIDGTGIPTREIVSRFLGGDSISTLVEDFGRTHAEIEDALRWEEAQVAYA
jgi:uncharacterized protein (DUF433 family)